MLKLCCTICGKLIKEVNSREASVLTGKEMCDICKDRVDTIYKELGDAHERYQKELEIRFNETIKEQAELKTKIQQHQQEIRATVGNIKGELSNIIRQMLEDRMKKVKPKKEPKEVQE